MRGFALAPVLALLVSPVPAAAQAAEAGGCRVMQMSFTPTSDLQIAIWIEDAQGNFVDTAYVTQLTGSYGIGNRPGIMEFNSEWRWPYGRRDNVLPVWAHRRGVEYPQLMFQDADDRDLSHPINDSSPESFFCRPLDIDQQRDEMMVDTTTCATSVYTDKGKFHPSAKSLYPPRNDLGGVLKPKAEGSPMCLDPDQAAAGVSCADHIHATQYADLNDLDAVSRATPPGGMEYSTHHQLPTDLPDGSYVVWIEVSKERDTNATYNSNTYPSPMVQWNQYGVAYRGQPSILWKVPITVMQGSAVQRFSARDYEGYGDPDGLEALINPPDSTITTNVEGSGANRLLLTSSPAGDYRLRVSVSVDDDGLAPAAPSAMSTADVTASTAAVQFTEPADDGDGVDSGAVTGYEVRYLVGEAITAENFFTKGKVVEAPSVKGPGMVQTVALEGLLPQTRYSVGIRALDNCLNASPLAVVELRTGRVEGGDVDTWCQVSAGGRGAVATVSVLLLLALGLVLTRRAR